MSPIDVEISTFGPVMGGLVGAGACAWGGAAGAVSAGAVGGGVVFASCPDADEASKANRARVGILGAWRHFRQKNREQSRPRLSCFRFGQRP